MTQKFRCPNCHKLIPVSAIASHLGTLGGAAGGASKSEAKRAAARLNLEKARAAKLRKK